MWPGVNCPPLAEASRRGQSNPTGKFYILIARSRENLLGLVAETTLCSEPRSRRHKMFPQFSDDNGEGLSAVLWSHFL